MVAGWDGGLSVAGAITCLVLPYCLSTLSVQVVTSWL